MAKHLQLISQELVKATREGNVRLIIEMPPRHGKSFLVSKYFPAWYLGTFPDNRIILASYESTFAASWGREARDLLVEHGNLFGVSVSQASSAADNWGLEGREGRMMTAGVGSGITGKGANILIIDDPTKDYEEAHSETICERNFNWLTSTALTRLEPDGSAIAMATRWSENDMIGQIERKLEGWRILRLPALADANDPLGRIEGEALWPERFDRKKLLSIKRDMREYQFSALYQQRPAPEEGNMFKRAWFSKHEFPPSEHWPRLRAWDKAGSTKAGSDFSAGVLMCVDGNGFYWVEDVIHGRWSPHVRNKLIKDTALIDAARYPDYSVLVEQEPGSGGLADAEFSVKDLAGYAVYVDKPTGKKDVRARPFASQAELGNVKVLRREWTDAWIEEHAVFPNGAHDDMVDASAAAFNRLALSQKLEAWVM